VAEVARILERDPQRERPPLRARLDEQLGDVDETEAVLAGESKSEEAEDETGPFEEAPNLADIELEE